MTMMLIYVLTLAALCAICVDSRNIAASHQIFEQSKIDYRSDVRMLEKARHSLEHEIVFSIAPKNLEVLENILYDVSSPKSSNYGNHWPRHQIEELTHNKLGHDLVIEFLQQNEITVTKLSKYGNYIHAKSSVEKWQRILSTEFHLFEVQHINKPLIRCLSFSLPANLHEHVQAVFNTVQFPPISSHFSKKVPYVSSHNSVQSLLDIQGVDIIPGYVTPALINQYYNVTNNTASFDVSQAVYESLDQEMSPTDLLKFQRLFNIPLQNITQNIGGNADATCSTTSGNCDEANLDIQYLMGIAQQANTTFWYTDDWLFGWILSVADSDSPSDVYSISYGGQETGLEYSYTSSFNTEAMKLGVMGVTILVASGDMGVGGSYAQEGSRYCGYNPQFPATSPYVTTVGATMGPENNEPEVGCQASPGGEVLITSGGGFSTLFGQPIWQRNMTENYFATVSGTNQAPYEGTTAEYYDVNYYSEYSDYIRIPSYFNSSGRGYPDVALLGHSYIIVVGGETAVVDGTSASTPVMASFVTLANHQRFLANASRMGFLNPFLYENGAEGGFVHDVTSGNNKCSEAYDCNSNGCKVHCCNEGFYATTGWDPMTGLGSIHYEAFVASALAVVGVSNAPSLRPSVAPHSKAPVTKSPSASPTVLPTHSHAPTHLPTLTPSHRPSVAGATESPIATLHPVTQPPVTQPPVTLPPSLAPSPFRIFTEEPTTSISQTHTPTYRPSTLAPTSNYFGISFPVNQVISGISQSSYESELTYNNMVLAQTVAAFVPGTTADTITVLSVLTYPLTAPNQLVSNGNNVRKSSNAQTTATSEILVAYSVLLPNIYAPNYASASAAYNTSCDLLTTAVLNDQFNTQLIEFAVATSKSNLNKVTVSMAPSFGGYSIVPPSNATAATTGKKATGMALSTGALAGIVVGGVCLLALLIVTMVYCQRKPSTETLHLSKNVDMESNPSSTASMAPQREQSQLSKWSARMNKFRFAGFDFDSETSQHRLSELTTITHNNNSNSINSNKTQKSTNQINNNNNNIANSSNIISMNNPLKTREARALSNPNRPDSTNSKDRQHSLQDVDLEGPSVNATYFTEKAPSAPFL